MRSKKRKESHWHDGQAGGYDWIARSTRLAIFIRDGWRCLACGYTASPDAPAADGAHPWSGLTLDHLRRDNMPKSEVHKPANLVTLCLSCNSARRASDPAAWDPAFAEVAYFQVTKPIDRKAALELARLRWPARYAKKAAAEQRRRDMRNAEAKASAA